MGESKQSEKTQRKRKRSPRLDGVGKKASHFDKEIWKGHLSCAVGGARA